MKAELSVRCSQCLKRLALVPVDTADMPEQLQGKVNTVILKHRKDCEYYKGAE